MKKTPWFPGHIKPVRKGVYERDYGIPSEQYVHYNYWDGRTWFIWANTPENAELQQQPSSFALPWRGLAEKP